MGNCKECKHWDKPVGNFEPYDPGPGPEARYCEKIRELIAPFEVYQGGQYPTEQMNIPIATAPGFGCVQFEVK